MTPNIQEIETKLRAALDVAVKDGRRPARQASSDLSKCGCVLQLLTEQESDYANASSLELGITQAEAWAIAWGWDGMMKAREAVQFPDLAHLGLRLGREYIDGEVSR